MEGKVCQHDKHGYCKFKDHCRKDHYSEICIEGGSCENIKVCNKRHPTHCRRFQMNKFCQFGSTCAYFHSELSNQINDVGTNELKRKLTSLENIMSGEVAQLKVNVKLLSNKIKDLETKLVGHSNTEKDPVVEVEEEATVAEKVENSINTQEDLANEMIEDHQGKIENSDIKEGVHSESKAKVFNCEQCEFSFKSKKKKHVKAKHLKNSEKCAKCKVCFYSKADLEKHMMKKHRKSKSKENNDTELIQEDKNKHDSESRDATTVSIIDLALAPLDQTF